MTDELKVTQPPEHPRSYRTCEACGCEVHLSRSCCPECGAFPHEDHPPAADTKLNLFFALLFAVILAGVLVGFSRNREAAALAEQEKFSRLNITLTDPQEDLVVAVPTPTPTALPTPIPATPTPAPFSIEDLRVDPTATPVPAPTRIPPTPTPVPEPTRSSTLDLKDELAEEFLADLDERFPMAKVGQFIRLTMRDNRVVSGTILQLEANQLALRNANGQTWVTYRLLSRRSRMQVDKSERETWAEERALEEVLKRLQN